MQKIMRHYFFCLLILGLVGCHALSHNSATDGLKLLPLIDGPKDFLYQQHIRLVSTDQSHDFIAVSKLQDEQLSVVVLLPNGQKVFSAFYDGSTFHQQQHTPVEVPTKDMMSMMQFALWPHHLIENSYTTAQHWQHQLGEKTRLLGRYGKDWLRVELGENTHIIYNEQRHYQVHIKHLNQGE